MTSTGPRVVVLVSPGCHLCDDACAIVSQVCTELEVEWTSTDLSEVDEPTRAKWREYTPVVLIDGAVHDIFRVTPDRLRVALGG